MSDPAGSRDEAPHGTALLPADLTEDQLGAAPVLDTIDCLLIEDLTDDEDDAFRLHLRREDPRRRRRVQHVRASRRWRADLDARVSRLAGHPDLPRRGHGCFPS